MLAVGPGAAPLPSGAGMDGEIPPIISPLRRAGVLLPAAQEVEASSENIILPSGPAHHGLGPGPGLPGTRLQDLDLVFRCPVLLG